MTKFALWLTGSEGAKFMTDVNKISVDCWVPLWLMPFIVVLLAVLTFYLYRRDKVLSRGQYLLLASLRTLAYCALLLTLAMPRLDIEGEGVQPGPVPMVIDGTQSMLIKDEANGRERADKAKELAAKLVETNPLKEELLLAPYWAGKDFKQWKPGDKDVPDGDYTSIARMLEGGIQGHLGEYCPGFILISDGANNSSEPIDPVIGLLQKRGVPVYAVGLGKESSKDLAITFIAGDDVIFINEKAKIFVNVNQHGYQGQKIALKLFLEDKEVYSGEHELAKDGDNGFPVEFKPTEKGVFRLKAEIPPLPGEITAENNTFIKSVRVIDEKIRILLVFGSPSWEYRYLTGAFERDKRVEFKSYLSDADARRFRDKSGANKLLYKLPESRAELNKDFDVVFISRVDAAQLPLKFLDALAEFVEVSGGGLAVLSDPFYIPFTLKGSKAESLIPVTIAKPTGRTYRDEMFNPLREEMHFEVTDDGMTNQLVLFSADKDANRKIWSEMPPVYDCYSQGRLKPSAINLLVTFQNRNRQSYPAIVHHSYGKGSVLFMGFDSTWRWRREFGDRFFRDYWGKAVQFLGLPHLLNEAAQSVIYVGAENCYAGEKFDIRAKVCNSDFSPHRAEKVKLTVRDSGVKREIDMSPISGREGMYRADYVPETTGELELSLPQRFSAKPVLLRVLKQRKEFIQSGMNRELLERICKDTGGKFFAAESADKLYPALVESRPKNSMTASVSLWDSWFMLLLAVALFAAEWVFRKLYCLD